ncbi:hypothetical protein IE53DRAFT_347333 [Violaceomyces palustris]|uniref:Uncharacterized protein n=1 Tax=Violaceomyces palustris TaxID=1673888 RepID=A0ACD0NRR8_9BASI|nr:hypothetical protein IE53DRAFT_347333 [Violaceomyces palustris]
MPRAKRSKVISLTKTDKKTKEDKANHMEKVRLAARDAPYVWLFSIANMRNSYLKEVRSLWKGSQIFYGKLKVAARALGTTAEDEVRPGISAISNRLNGNVGLLFTDSPPSEVIDWFKHYTRRDYARAGSRATRTVELPEGPVMAEANPPETLPHSIEPQLRGLGMPTELKRGVPTLLRDFRVCKEGEALTSEKAQILKHLLIQMADFRIVPLAYWSAASAEQGEEAVVNMDLTEEEKELVGQKVGEVRIGKKGSGKGTTPRSTKSKRASEGSDDEMEEEEEEDSDDEDIEDEDKVTDTMMLPPGIKL